MKKDDVQILEQLHFSQIMKLDISDSEKIRLDQVAQQIGKKCIEQNNLYEVSGINSFHDLEQLIKAGVVEKKYNFTCPACGATCMTISEDDLKGYLRVWELLKMVPLSSAQIVEYDNLCAKGFYYIGLLCLNKKCTEGIDATINSMDELREFARYIDVVYSINPNLELRSGLND